MAPDIQPYNISVSDDAIASLKSKLESATFPPEVDFSNDWGYGAPLGDIERLAKYWADGFDWRAQEIRLNKLPQYLTKVTIESFGDMDIHFVHQQSNAPASIPLLFVHGWPGSFLEVEKLLPLLTAPDDGGPSFHVVAPSLPNFGFSEGASKPGFGVLQYAEAMHNVMLNLGYHQYVTQGGDWGFKVTRAIGYRYPKHCLASHINLVLARTPKLLKTPVQWLKHALLPYSKDEKEGIARTAWFDKEGFGYNLLQSTKPSTIGFALADSPVALLAWIYEKLHDWTDSYPWTDDEILTWISVYQFSRAGPAASSRIYYEIQHPVKIEQSDQIVSGYIPDVKLGLSYFPRDIHVPPRTWGHTLGPVVYEASHADGGHFAAHERPELLAADLKKMFAKNGAASSVVNTLASE